jgi:hypothetical protein
MPERKRKDWRELCAAVSKESDSKKLGCLVEELIAALDDHERTPSVGTIPRSSDEAAFSSR